ncbi:MAG: hypothetical protein ACREBQ_01655 [Nitrososphaerales archaeon]
MIGLLQFILPLQFLPNLPTTGTSPSTPYTAALELAFVFGAALIALVVVLEDPIYPKAEKKGGNKNATDRPI